MRTASNVHAMLNDGGVLDGLAVLRFAHAYESGGGTERYLDDLDRVLLARNAMTIVRLHLTRSPYPDVTTESRVGRGRLLLVPLAVRPENANASPLLTDQQQFRLRTKQLLRDWVIYNPLVWRAAGALWTASLRLPCQAGQAIGAGAAAAEVFSTHRVDLVMLHFFGGADAEEVLNESRKAGVPVALLNHYSNDRFLNLSIRKHALLADAFAGVNGLGLPSYLRHGFTNLSDGIDTEFFCQANARPLGQQPEQPVILLPARVVREKGQLDLVRAAAMLRKSGLDCCLAFAGRMDASGYVTELHRTIEEVGMTECVHFLGNLDLETLRDWYGASAIVALPTYHDEGLPRVILEAQAMAAPLVAYASGGVPEGIKSGYTGYLVRTGDVARLAESLRVLLASPSLRSSMGANGRKSVEALFSLNALAERHEKFYSKIIAANQLRAADRKLMTNRFQPAC